MLLSFVAYLGFAAAGAGAISILWPLRRLRIRTRSMGAAVVLGGCTVAAVALMMPSRENRTSERMTHLDQYMPLWQFGEHHSIRVNASCEEVYKAIRAVRADEIFLFRTLTTIRRLGRPGPENILNAPEQKPIIDVATQTTFLLLADTPPREILVGTVVVAPPDEVRKQRALTPDLFRKKLKPGVALATMNFLVLPDVEGGSLVSTETRVFANSSSAARRFAIYWRLILPGSDLIRRSWLRAIKHRAERKPT